MKRLIITIHILILGLILPQVSAELTIENQQISGTDVYFDIYIVTTGVENLYLGTADFVLTFNAGAFINPSLTRETSEYWNLVSASGSSVASLYRSATLPKIITDNEIIINLNQVAFGNQSEFEDNVAIINNISSTYRIGRYKIGGISNPAAYMNLRWKTSGQGVTTRVFTLQNSEPWSSNPVLLDAVDPGNSPLPIELANFTVKRVEQTVKLNWETKTEVNNHGFDIERKSGTNNYWNKIGFISGKGNSNAFQNYNFIDNKIFGHNKFQYRLKLINNNGEYNYSDIVEVEVKPDKYELSQNYPNPFNPTTFINYGVPVKSFVILKIYDIIGNEVATIVNEEKNPGFYKVEWNASGLGSGVYIYKLQIVSFGSVLEQGNLLIKKLILMK